MIEYTLREETADRYSATAWDGGVPATFSEVLGAWRCGAGVEAWAACLARIPYQGFCFETPPLARATVGRPFECSFIRSPGLSGLRADPVPFSEHFARATTSVVAFDSLGKDARLIAPCPGGDGANFAHLGTFQRTAGDAQVRALWAEVGAQANAAVGRAPRWLSTAGLGVHWLHVRLDTRPKY